MHVDWCSLNWPTGFRCVTIVGIRFINYRVAKIRYVVPTDQPGFS